MKGDIQNFLTLGNPSPNLGVFQHMRERGSSRGAAPQAFQSAIASTHPAGPSSAARTHVSSPFRPFPGQHLGSSQDVASSLLVAGGAVAGIGASSRLRNAHLTSGLVNIGTRKARAVRNCDRTEAVQQSSFQDHHITIGFYQTSERTPVMWAI